MTTMNNHAVEKSTYVIGANFYDSANNAVTPSSANWTLTDANNAIINARNAVSVTPANNAASVTLSGNDLAAANNEAGDTFARVFTLQAVYTSTEGSGLTLKQECKFFVDNLLSVS